MACKALAVVLGLWMAGTAIAAPPLAVPPPAPTIVVSDAWIRWLPSNLPAGGYMTLKNTGAQPQVLTGATSPDFADVSLHQSIEQDGVSQMQPVSQLNIPPGGVLSL